jgi:hypothetical protein
LRQYLFALALCAFALSGGSAAAADATTTIQRYTYSQPVLNCGSFDVIQSGEVQQIVTVFQNGSSNRVWVHSKTAITFTNSVSGASLTGLAVPTFQFSSDNTAQVGLFLRIVIPGVGAEVLETGVVRTVDNEVVFEAGQFDSSIDLCAALS